MSNWLMWRRISGIRVDRRRWWCLGRRRSGRDVIGYPVDALAHTVGLKRYNSLDIELNHRLLGRRLYERMVAARYK